MKLIAFCIRDVVVGNYNRPYFMVSRGQAVRTFTDEINRPSEDNPMYKHPTDFELYQVGEFDDESGLFVPLPSPEFVISGSTVTVK